MTIIAFIKLNLLHELSTLYYFYFFLLQNFFILMCTHITLFTYENSVTVYKFKNTHINTHITHAYAYM